MLGEFGMYSLADLARLLREPRETAREWTLKGLAPTRTRGDRQSPGVYTFADLISLYVVSELRTRGVPLERIRKAEEWLRKACGVERPFATWRLYSAGKDVFVRLASDDPTAPALVAASRSGQGAIDDAFQAVLRSVRYSGDEASAWEPWEDVEVNPRRQFGAPCLAGTGIQTSTLFRFVLAGDDPREIAELYGVPLERVEHAIRWEESLAKAA
jgi:uncharacterized protein (DUF433 family)